MKSLVIVAALATPAYAIGLCEDTPRHYSAPKLYSPIEHAFAVEVTQAWCEVERGNLERRGTIAYVDLVGPNGASTKLSTATGADAMRLEKAIGSFEPVSKIAVELARRGYLPIVSSRRCSVSPAWTGDAFSEGGWPMIEMGVDLRRGTARLAHEDLGGAAKERTRDAIVRGHWLAAEASVVVFSLVPTCAGPPPGYFGAGDAGVCYRIDTPDVRVIPAKDCF